MLSRRPSRTCRLPVALLTAVALLSVPAASPAQMTERPGTSLDDPIDRPHDPTGLSIKAPRVRVVHTTDPALAGGSMYLQRVDPWLGYQWGRDLFQREFRERDGVYGDAGKLDGPMLPDGASHMMSRSHVNSCGVCHNTPYRDAGAGATIPKNGGEGRNTPHMFGAGLVEMLGQQMRLQAMAVADANRDGWVSLAEAKGKRLVLANLPAGVAGRRVEVDYGAFEDADGNGKPDLNPLLNPIYVDAEGKRVPTAHSLKFPGVAGFTFEVQCMGFGHLYVPFRPPVSTTLRAFFATPMDVHSGLQAFDPTTLTEATPQGFSRHSNAGCQQCVTAAGKDRGAMRGKTGLSHDDPDRDGYCEEISEGDLDVAEWYMLNHPKPGRGRVTPAVRKGEALFDAIGCATCHVPDWHLAAYDPAETDYTKQFAGDRRFFDVEVAFNDRSERLEGRLIPLADRTSDGLAIPRRGAYTVRGFYSDLKYHDVGEAFWQVQFDGTVVKQFRTSPLWGVGSTAPYGHDGASLSLDDVIRRHGGAALQSRQAYAALSEEDRCAVLAFLNSLVLYQTDRLPCDVDGDGVVSDRFVVADTDTGVERLNPEWLFNTPGKVEGPITNLHGTKVMSSALTNIRDAYGLTLPYLRDADRDGFPDVVDPEPRRTGYMNGAK